MGRDKTPKVAKALDKVRRKVTVGWTGYLLENADELGAGYVPAAIGDGGDGRMTFGWTPLNRIGEERLRIRLAENGDLTRAAIVAAAAIAVVKDGETEGVIYDVLTKLPSQIPIDREWLLELARTSQTFAVSTTGDFLVTSGGDTLVTAAGDALVWG